MGVSVIWANISLFHKVVKLRGIWFLNQLRGIRLVEGDVVFVCLGLGWGLVGVVFEAVLGAGSVTTRGNNLR